MQIALITLADDEIDFEECKWRAMDGQHRPRLVEGEVVVTTEEEAVIEGDGESCNFFDEFCFSLTHADHIHNSSRSRDRRRRSYSNDRYRKSDRDSRSKSRSRDKESRSPPPRKSRSRSRSRRESRSRS